MSYNYLLKLLLASDMFISLYISLAELSKIATSELVLTPYSHLAGRGKIESASQEEIVNMLSNNTIYLYVPLTVVAHRTELRILKLDLGSSREVAYVL